MRRNSSGCRSLLAEYLGPQRRLFPRGLEIPTERIADTGRRGVFVGLALCDTARGAVREVPLLQQYAKPENPQRKTISMTALFLFLATFSFSSESGIYGKSVLGTEPGTVQVGEGLGAKNQDFCDETRNQGRLRLHGPIPCFMDRRACSQSTVVELWPSILAPIDLRDIAPALRWLRATVPRQPPPLRVIP